MGHGIREGPEQIKKKKNEDHAFLMFFAASTFQAPAKFTDTHYDMIDYQKLEESFEEDQSKK